MPRHPDVPCADCGVMLYSGRASLPAGQRRCRACRRGTRQRLCKSCGAWFTSARPSRGSYCSIACAGKARSEALAQRPPSPRACAECGAEFFTSSHHRFCRPCKRAHDNARDVRKTRARRALKRGAKAERYTLDEIASRDKYRCKLCGKRVAMTRKYPDPRSPVIDHVIPIVEGGDDVKANVQLAHFVCNARKRQYGTQQLALIG